jgi:hypothetical protein
MSNLRWLRTEWMKPVPRWERDDTGHLKKYAVQFLRAVRSDGQMFVVWDDVGPQTTPEILRARLDTMLDSPELPPTFDEENGTWNSPLVNLDFSKGREGWVEEPEP